MHVGRSVHGKSGFGRIPLTRPRGGGATLSPARYIWATESGWGEGRGEGFVNMSVNENKDRSVTRRFSFGERVDDPDTGIAEPGLVTAHHREIVDHRRRGHKSIQYGHGLA